MVVWTLLDPFGLGDANNLTGSFERVRMAPNRTQTRRFPFRPGSDIRDGLNASRMSRGPYADPVIRNPNRCRRGDRDPLRVRGVSPVCSVFQARAGRAAARHRALDARGGLPQWREF
jgi:hypothetical protein